MKLLKIHRQKAIQDELQSLKNNKTWTLVELPKGKKAVGCKWIFKMKFKSDGTLERHKARLVAKGYTQTRGLDYEETFSPVAKMTTIRCLLAIAAARNWIIHQLDVNTAFLHGDLMEEVYMKPPEGLNFSHPNQVCKLQKSIYGLKQWSRQWNIKLTKALRRIGYTQSKADYTLFTKRDRSNFTAILVYVDDLVITGNNINEINKVKQYLHKKFNIKDLGDLKYFLGLEVARSKKGIFISQRKYAIDLLKDTGLLASKPSNIPMEPNLKLQKDPNNLYQDISAYRRLVGRLIYLCNTRPYLSYSVGQLSHHLDCPTKLHHHAAIKILRYIKKTPGEGLLFPECVGSLTLQ